MKKTLNILVLALLIAVTGCSNQEDPESLKVIAPNGTPALSQVYMEYHKPSIDSATYSIDIVNGAEPLVAAFGSESHDIIYAPTNLGARLISTGVPYQFAATVNWGNSYLASSTPIHSLSDLDGKEIIAFGQNATPDIVLRTLLNHESYDTYPTITYVDSVQSALANLIEDDSRIVLLAEPVLSTGQQELDSLFVIDLQEAWREVTGMNSYPQAGIFVKTSLNDKVVSSYLNRVEESISQINQNTEEVAALAAELDYPFPIPVLINAIPRSNIYFETALNSKDDLIYYFEQILNLQGNLINNSLPDDDFYFIDE